MEEDGILTLEMLERAIEKLRHPRRPTKEEVDLFLSIWRDELAFWEAYKEEEDANARIIADDVDMGAWDRSL